MTYMCDQCFCERVKYEPTCSCDTNENGCPLANGKCKGRMHLVPPFDERKWKELNKRMKARDEALFNKKKEEC